nr:unnamed protein product [Callosobruchus analis]
MRHTCAWCIASVLVLLLQEATHGIIWNAVDVRYWRCNLKKVYECPDNDIRFYLYTNVTGKQRQRIDVRNHYALKYAGYEPEKKNVIIIHGFNGTESRTPITLLRNTYLERGDYNIFTVDWERLTRFPCYLSALSNTRLVGMCTAHLYAYIMNHGGDAELTTCLGHSLGAHICGMASKHLSIKQHRIIGLDPARPLIDRFAHKEFRLGKEDAHQVEVIHTNAGFLGERNQIGTVDFCVNGGSRQPSCYGTRLQQVRCSHFQSACYFARTLMLDSKPIIGRPCSSECPKRSSSKWGYVPGKSIPMGENTPFNARGTYCVETDTKKDCPYFQ